MTALVVGVVLQQMHINKALKRYGAKAEAAGKKEMRQIHERQAVVPVHLDSLSEKERKEIIDSLLLIEEKRDGTIKGREVARGDQQKQYHTKEEVHSPTVTTASVMITAAIEAKEGRDTCVHDVPNAFCQAHNDEKVIMKIKGKAADYLMLADPRLYRKFVQLENGATVLFVQLKMALYGQLKAALLFYKKFVKDLEDIGFVLNAYDPCVANRMVQGSQHTVCWHVDDIKSSHISSQVQDDFENWLIDMYDRDLQGKLVGKLKKCMGKKLDYLGMILNFETPGQVTFDMEEYTKNMVSSFEDPLGQPLKEAKTPATDHLFQVRESQDGLSEDRGLLFRNATAKALYLCKRARPDIHTAVSFLTTRVRAPDQDDWKKLIRMMGYLKATRALGLTLRDKGNGVTWWVDASFAVHPDMQGHTGGTMTLGKGSIITKSAKQKLNTSSSTEAELVGTYDMMLEILWTNYFLEAQGYDYGPVMIYQDNLLAMLLQKNGKISSTKRTKHINIRYYLIHDWWKRGEVNIKHCSTEDMVTDFLANHYKAKSSSGLGQ